MKTTRDAMAAAFAEAEGAAEEPEVEAEEGAEPEVEVEEPETPAEEGDESEEPAEETEAEARARDDKGRFAKEARALAEKAKAAGKKPDADAAAQAAAAQQTALKPPADWKPAAREEFAKLPRIVQEEAIRLHLETKKVLQDSAQSRQIADTFQRTVQPYAHIFRAAGRSEIEGVGYLLQTYAQLQTAPMQQRAQLIGGFIRDFLGTDDNAINLLAATLEGKGGGPAHGAGGGAAPITPQQIQQMVQEAAQKQTAQAGHQAELKAITDFEQSAPEFLNDVTNEIKAIVAIEKQQGKPITVELLKAAYDRAVRLNSHTAPILKQRDDGAAAKKKQDEAKKRKGAELGLKNEPPGPGSSGSGKAKNTREELAREFAKAERGNRV